MVKDSCCYLESTLHTNPQGIASIVELYLDGAVEVEFVTAGGKTQALLTLEGDQFSPLGPQDMLAARKLDAA